MFGPSSSLPPLTGVGGGLVCDSVGKANLLSEHFDSNQTRDSVDLPSSCHTSSSLTIDAFTVDRVRFGDTCLTWIPTFLRGQLIFWPKSQCGFSASSSFG